MKRFWMRSLSGQLIGLMLLALLASQGVAFLFHRSDRVNLLRSVQRDEFLARVASVSRLIATTDPSLHPEILRAPSTTQTRYWLSPEGPAEPQAWQRIARDFLMRALPSRPGANQPGRQPADKGSFVTNPRFSEDDLRVAVGPAWEMLAPESWPGGRPARVLTLDAWNGLGVAVQIREGLWLHTVYAKPDLITQSPANYYVSFGCTAVLLLLVAVLAARRVGRPLQRLTDQAERLGRGENLAPLPEAGPEDIRRTTEAFNRMQERIKRFVEGRTQMLAAISHDLRTPITSLRLRAEFVEDPEMKEKLIATLDEMQTMTEAALAFAREEAVVEPTRTTDLDALIESLCVDLAELGWDVKFADGDRVPWRGRPDGLRRALRNVIENAVRYGERARVRLVVLDQWFEIVVEDDGPGIPEADFERVFAPFVRLETSRNRATGGVGLGLAIARSIARSHGGDILLVNWKDKTSGGLRAVIRLPRAAEDAGLPTAETRLSSSTPA
jgi:signal transduction histidine kinase